MTRIPLRGCGTRSFPPSPTHRVWPWQERLVRSCVPNVTGIMCFPNGIFWSHTIWPWQNGQARENQLRNMFLFSKSTHCRWRKCCPYQHGRQAGKVARPAATVRQRITAIISLYATQTKRNTPINVQYFLVMANFKLKNPAHSWPNFCSEWHRMILMSIYFWCTLSGRQHAAKAILKIKALQTIHDRQCLGRLLFWSWLSWRVAAGLTCPLDWRLAWAQFL